MEVIRRIVAIVLQLGLGCFIGSLSAYISWIPLSRVPFLSDGLSLLMGVIFGTGVTIGLVLSIGVVFMFRGDWRYTVLAALVGIVLTFWVSRFPFISAWGYAQMPFIEAIPAVLATSLFHITDRLRRPSSKVIQVNESQVLG